jgi:hypothetical protein
MAARRRQNTPRRSDTSPRCACLHCMRIFSMLLVRSAQTEPRYPGSGTLKAALCRRCSRCFLRQQNGSACLTAHCLSPSSRAILTAPSRILWSRRSAKSTGCSSRCPTRMSCQHRTMTTTGTCSQERSRTSRLVRKETRLSMKQRGSAERRSTADSSTRFVYSPVISGVSDLFTVRLAGALAKTVRTDGGRDQKRIGIGCFSRNPQLYQRISPCVGHTARSAHKRRILVRALELVPFRFASSGAHRVSDLHSHPVS